MSSPFDEMHSAPDAVRAHYGRYEQWLREQPGELMRARREEAELIFRRVGITFAVYGAKDEEGAGTERLIPFDLIPRIIQPTSGARWSVAWRSASRRSTVSSTTSITARTS